MPHPPITALLWDMNGLFRHWHNTGAQTGQTLAHLPEGTIAAYAYQHRTYHLARVGVLTDQQWADDVTRRLSADFGPRALAAIAPWRADRGTPTTPWSTSSPRPGDTCPSAYSPTPPTRCAPTSPTTTSPSTSCAPPPNSAWTNPPPTPSASHAAHGMGRPPEQLLYFDDEPTFVAAARHTGLRAELFTSPAHFAQTLNDHGIPVHTPQHSCAQGSQQQISGQV